MYKLLIVDDEPLVQIGLQSMLPWAEHDIEICGTAGNGVEALKLIETLQPQLVIADIKMPMMNGLELLRESTERFGPVPTFIILTSYEEYQLVKQAISYQAVDYLVKLELDAPQLLAAIQKASARVDEHLSHQAAQLARGQESYAVAAYQEKFWLKLLNRLLPAQPSLPEQAQQVQIDLSYQRYVCVYACLHEVESRPALYSACQRMIREILERYAGFYSLSNDPSHLSLIFFFEEQQAVAERMSLIQQGINNCVEMLKSYFNVNVSFGVGTAVASPDEIATSFEEAKTAEKESSEANPIRIFSHLVGANRRSGKDRLISSIQSYIDENLGGKLLLNEVAEVFGLSPNYLSILFKKNCDLGFTEYINTRKIEKAKQLLLAGDMRIYEVADALGFESAFYFSKVFKKIDGHSPREYIQKKTEGFVPPASEN